MNKHKNLLQKFTEYNATKRLAGRKKPCLLAVSGGIDSVVMCHLFVKAGFPFAIAHCNFGLRGEESERDELFVIELGVQYKVQVLVKKFDTAAVAAKEKISIQLAARELRYTWFEEMRKENNLDLIAAAHQLNDNIETIIYNLTKGTGVRGLRGIPERQGKIIRPLLFASREEIEQYQLEHGLAYREDSSNLKDDYSRNKIRHHVIPLLKEINPSLEHTLAERIDVFKELELLYEKQVQRSSKQLFLQRGNDVYIPILKLKKERNAASVLFEYLKEFGFNITQVEDMLSTLDDTPGKQFITGKARLIKDRRFLILTRLPASDTAIHLINNGDKELNLNGEKLKLELLNAAEANITPSKSLGFADYDELEFPLIVRRWKQGDYFYPFGMKMKKKKLKKFFIEQKVPLNEKENIWVVESAGRIVWVAGYRLDERFKITPSTQTVFKMELK